MNPSSSSLLHWMRIWGWKLILVPPLTSWLMWSPYFFGAKRAANHLRLSTCSRARCTLTGLSSSILSDSSRISFVNLSACSSRARAYWSRKSPFPNNPQADEQLQELQAAARTLGVQVEAFKAGSPSEVDAA